MFSGCVKIALHEYAGATKVLRDLHQQKVALLLIYEEDVCMACPTKSCKLYVLKTFSAGLGLSEEDWGALMRLGA